MTDDVTFATAAGVAVLTMNRPQKKNALTHAMYAALADGIAAAEADAGVRALLLTGSGDSFTSGNDLKDFAGPPPAGDGEAPVLRFLRAISTAQKPIVAAVNGLAVGVGTTMLLHCDLVYAARSATFSAPFVDLALVPEAASSLLLPQRVGHARAADLFLLGARWSSAQAEAGGLVAAVYDDAALLAEATKKAQALAAKAPTAVRLTKMLMKRGPEPVAARMAEEGRHFAAQLQSAELREAIMAFMQKRVPDFSKAS
jgi:enoyl-CoA hydratase/carnithine racemase